jgi:hypothetical protein
MEDSRGKFRLGWVFTRYHAAEDQNSLSKQRQAGSSLCLAKTAIEMDDQSRASFCMLLPFSSSSTARPGLILSAQVVSGQTGPVQTSRGPDMVPAHRAPFLAW